MPAWRKILWSVTCAAGLLLLAVDEIFSAIEFTIGTLTQNNDEIEVEVMIKGLSNSSCFESRCYLQGLLTVEDQNQYFGFTQNNQSNWYEYVGSPEIEFIKSTFFSFVPIEGSWSGKLKIKNNPNDNDYKGPGKHALQVRRYSGKSNSHAGESNTLSVELSYVLPTPIPTPSNTSTPTPTPSIDQREALTPSPNPVASSNAPPSGEEGTLGSSDEVIVGRVAGFSFDKSENQLVATEEARFELLESSRSASQTGVITDDEATQPLKAKNWFPFAVGGVFLVGSVVSWALKRYNRGSLWEKLESSP